MSLVELVIAGLSMCLSPVASAVPAQDPPKLSITGTLWIVEGATKRLPVGGSFHLCYDDWFGGNSIEVPLIAGAFRCEVPATSEYLEMGRIRVEGREAACTWTGKPADVTAPLALEARLLPESRLRVRIQSTGIELDRCTMPAYSDSDPARSVTLPLVVAPWEEDCSPFGWRSVRQLRARAPGFAWSGVDVDLLAGGDFWIELVPEARITATVVLPASLPPQHLSVHASNGWSAHQRLAHDGQALCFDGLLPGRYQFDTALDGPGTHSLITRAVVDLAGGETRHLTLDFSGDVPKQRAPARGTLSIDPSWGSELEPPRLAFLRQDPATGRHVDELTVDSRLYAAGRFSWDAGLLAVGKHAVVVEPFGWVTELIVAEAAVPAALAVPARVRCRVRLVDAQTRAPLKRDTISWRGVPEKFNGSVDSKTVQLTPAAEHFEFDAALGPVTISAHAEGFEHRRVTTLVSGELKEITIALEPVCRIRVRLRDGERTVLFPSGCSPSARSLDEHDGDQSRTWSGDSITLDVRQPGRYEIWMPEVEGFQKPVPIVVEARRSEVVEVVFRLIRR